MSMQSESAQGEAAASAMGRGRGGAAFRGRGRGMRRRWTWPGSDALKLDLAHCTQGFKLRTNVFVCEGKKMVGFVNAVFTM